MIQPKILTCVTVPTGGWDLKIYVSDAGNYDKHATANLAAGDYFISADNQSDDLLSALAAAIEAAIAALTIGGNAIGSKACVIWLDNSNKVRIGFESQYFTGATNRPVKLAWTESSSDLAAALGFDSSADDAVSSVNFPVFTADWQHAFGWYAMQDGLLNSSMVVDVNNVSVLQAVADSGKVKTQRIAQRYTNMIKLQFLPQELTFSNSVEYGDANVYPYERNIGLECWWLEASQGKRFRFYRDGTRNSLTDYANAPLGGVQTSGTTTTMTDTHLAMDTDPQRFKGALLVVAGFSANVTDTETNEAPHQHMFISSHTATAFTIAQVYGGANYETDDNSQSYYVLDHTYQTYVLDLANMPMFAPEELDFINQYNLEIPVLRYV